MASTDCHPDGVTPRVFLSYSHDSEPHRAWVRLLAERLLEGGVVVTLDQWDLRPGGDVVRFMEHGIRDADRVLMVCTANYVAKAEERKGGAGYEGMIVTGHVARATDTIKFVPIVRDHTGESLVPAFLGQRLWLDFRDDGAFEARLEELLRELHGAPRYKKPPLGRNPFAGSEPEGAAKGQESPSPSPSPGPSQGSRGSRQDGAHRGAKGPAASTPEGNSASVPASAADPASAPAATPAAPAPQDTPAGGAVPASPPSSAASPPSLALSPLTVTTARLRREGNLWKRWQVDRQEVRVQACELELGEGERLRLIQVPAGEFLMGSPADDSDPYRSDCPQHRVLLKGFLIGQTPITQAQWRAVARQVPPLGQCWERELALNPSGITGQPDSDQRPVEQVSWLDAMEFCHRLSQRRSGLSFTLPSEAQWEYACRAGSSTRFAYGATLSAELANYNATSTYGGGAKGEYRMQTTPVGMFPANAWGLQDMHGNVWEWCLDHWHCSYRGAPSDGSAWPNNAAEPNGAKRLLRGGSWYDGPMGCRSAYRRPYQPGDTSLTVGLRVVCLPQAPSLNT
jgi:formylglycine-generating enzyme required for sulfatase activity